MGTGNLKPASWRYVAKKQMYEPDTLGGGENVDVDELLLNKSVKSPWSSAGFLVLVLENVF